MAKLLLFNKPYKVLSQFSAPRPDDTAGERLTLANFIKAPGFYPAGRLDYHSEGLLLLTDNGNLQARIASPGFRTWKYYWLQVDGQVSQQKLDTLRQGVALKDGKTLPARVEMLANEPTLWPRLPTVDPTRAKRACWLEFTICEGRNRQLRRMCAAVDLSVLRLVRHRIGDWRIGNLLPGQQREMTIHLPVKRNSAATRRTARITR
ncbi:MAG: pseudouridine synthase [Pseudomonadales bacterium]